MQQPVTIYCPQCGAKIMYECRLCGHRHGQAVRLQAERLGVEVTCRTCETTFVFARVASIKKFRRDRDPDALQHPGSPGPLRRAPKMVSAPLRIG